MTRRRNYEVGYRRPPREYQFKPGHSGNPRGRPKERRTMYDVLNDLVERKVSTNTSEVSGIEAMVRRIIKDAMNGGPRAFRLFVKFARRADLFSDIFGRPKRIGTDPIKEITEEIEKLERKLAEMD
jgi:hypothetical protein